MSSKTFKTTLLHEGNLTAIEVPFDPKSVFGKTRVPVKVTLNGYTYRSTIASMGGRFLIPLRKSNREAAGLTGDETLEVRLDADTEAREIKPPADLAKALKAAPPAWDRWNELSFSHQREYATAVEEAKKPETRERRIASAVREIAKRLAKKR
ncbi:MAG: YdeI/OmpD-associated family protein [Thermoanaerobaculia bacterium]